jgi:hypothetical protein
MNRCKTCAYWQEDNEPPYGLCHPVDPDTGEKMAWPFEVRICKMPTQTRFEPPTESDGFALSDASEYYAVFATGENFGCVRHKKTLVACVTALFTA